MYFNDNEMALIVVKCDIKLDYILPENWNLNRCFTLMLKRNIGDTDE